MVSFTKLPPTPVWQEVTAGEQNPQFQLLLWLSLYFAFPYCLSEWNKFKHLLVGESICPLKK